MEAAAVKGRTPEGQPLPALPDSLLLQILALLPFWVRLRAAGVCSRWRRLVQDRMFWRHVDLTPYMFSSEFLWHLVHNYFRGNLQTLRVRGLLPSQKQTLLSPKLMMALGQQCPNLRHLCLTKANLSSCEYRYFPPSLTKLELNCCKIAPTWIQRYSSSRTPKAFPGIQHLLIKDIQDFADHHLAYFSRQGTLQTLFLMGSSKLTRYGPPTALPHLGELESLSLRQSNMAVFMTLLIQRYTKRLRFLDLSRTSVSDDAFSYLSGLESLEDLHLQKCCLPQRAIETTCRALPRLKHLGLCKDKFSEVSICQIEAALPNCAVTCTTRCEFARQRRNLWVSLDEEDEE